MSKTLILMRHGEAVDVGGGGGDYARALTPHGSAACRAQGAALLQKKIHPEFVICSAATRTRQTYEAVREGWNGAIDPPHLSTPELYQAAPEDVFTLIKEHGEAHSAVMIIGHNPTIHQMALQLCESGEAGRLRSYPPGALTLLQFDLQSWDDIGISKGSLIDFIKPAR